MSEAPDRDVRVFTEALQLPAVQRAAYLERACAGDPELRRKVEALLEGHDKAGDFLDDSSSRAPVQARLGSPVGEKPGDRVGRYKLLQQIGEGGCGVVFMAEQDEPLRRRVALKIIKPGMDTKSVIARFEAERQALALMDHPSIAKIFDAGATESGRPYFVMELVRGSKITEYCDQHSLTTEERLKLFAQVCQAIQHAHQKGIIHRDIKPSNILVTTTLEGKRLPVVIDFGIAKATTNQRLTDKTLFTAFEMLIGTPAYMSPEQAELSSADVDTRTDIYSLGVLLYELLTGSTPFDTGTLLKAGLDKIRQVIREREPARPSTRLSKMTVADITTVAQRRKSEAPALIHAISGDLDWITMKALEKDRTRRYETAFGMALDIKRYLANEPVAARPAGTMYLLQKLIRRNKLAFGAGTAIVVVLVLGIVASLGEAARANREADRAGAAEHQATAKAAEERKAREESDSILKFMTEVFQSPDPTRDGRTITVADLLDRAAERVETDLTNQPDLQASLEGTLATTYYNLGVASNAIPLQEKLRDYYLKTLGLESTKTLDILNSLAKSYYDAGRRNEALKLREEVLRLSQKVNGSEHPDTIEAMAELATSYYDAGRRNEALRLREEVLALSRKVNGPKGHVTLEAMGELAKSYEDAGRPGEALKLREDRLPLSRKLNGPESSDTLVAMGELAISYLNAGRGDQAIKLEEEVLAVRQKVNGPDNPETLIAMNNLAAAYSQIGRKDDALKLQEVVLALRRKVSGPEHPDTLIAMANLASSYFGADRKDQAIKLQEEVVALGRKIKGPEHPETLAAMGNLAFCYQDTGRMDDAIKLQEQVLALTRKVSGPGQRDTRDAMDKLAEYYAEAGHKKEALDLREALLALQRKALEDNSSLNQQPNSTERAALYAELGFNLDAMGRGDEAIKAWQEAVRINPSVTQDAAFWLGKALMDRQRFADALPILRATQKFYPDGDHGQKAAEWIALAEAMLAGPDAKSAAADRFLAALRKTVAANPTDTDQAKHLATVYLWLGQTNEYEGICRKLLDLAANSEDPSTHDRAAKAYLIQSHPDPETLKKAVAFGRQALKLAPANDSNRPWFLVTAGMAAVRDGKPAEAESLLNKALKLAGNDPNLRGLALAYRALARAHLGRMEEARADLADLEKLAPALPTPPASPAILLQPDFLAICLAHAEAKALLNPTPPPAKP